jgi:hypothetical protein
MTTFITAQQAVDLAFEDKSFYPDYISTAIIFECQEGNFKPALGKEYYAELLLQFAANNSSYTTANRFMMDNFLKLSLAYFVKAKIVPAQVARLSNSGLMAATGPNEIQASPAAMAKSVESHLASANFWLGSALSYMEDELNADNYPTYNRNREADATGGDNFNSSSVWVNL